jgi:hypothetical protein
MIESEARFGCGPGDVVAASRSQSLWSAVRALSITEPSLLCNRMMNVLLLEDIYEDRASKQALQDSSRMSESTGSSFPLHVPAVNRISQRHAKTGDHGDGLYKSPEERVDLSAIMHRSDD